MPSLHSIRRSLKHWWQRRTRGWDDTELWSIDYSLARWMVPRLAAFRLRKHGTPLAMWEESDGTEESGSPIMDKASLRWWCVLTEMEVGFRALYEEQPDYNDDLKEWMRREDERCAKVQHAFDLLAKYHHCLWD